MTSEKKGRLLIVSGASGTGKGTVCAALLAARENLAYSISATTRTPRPGEVEGENYYFITKEKFKELIAAGGFLEWAEVFGNFYGTPRQKVEDKLAAGQDILLEIDTQGALQVMKKCPEAISIFLLPPSLEELERRLRSRGTETEDKIKERLGEAQAEMAAAKHYKHTVINDTVDAAVKEIIGILNGE